MTGLTVAHVSDLHLGAHEPGSVESVAADVAAARPALTVVTGDCTMRARPREFRLARAALSRLPPPVLVVAGNHDLPLVSPWRLLRPYSRFESWLCAELDPVVRVPGLTAAGLMSMPRWRWKNGRVTRRQTARLSGVFGAAPDTDIRLLALHHPPVGRMLAGRGRLLRAAGSAGVDLLLAGHTHLPEVRVVGCTVVVVAGTATSHRLRGTPRSWSLISVGAEAVTVRERYAGADGWRTGREVRVPRPGQVTTR